eukprot:4204884-Pyramimonas_sp.AAC.1
MMWSVANSDLNEFRQAAYVSSRLASVVLEYVDEWPPVAPIQGAALNGNPVPPTAFLMHSLTELWGHLGEEERTSAVSALVSFYRLPQERIDDLPERSDILRNRAQQA